MQSEEHERRRLLHQEWWITQRFLTRVQFIYSVDRARNHYSITEAGLAAEKNVKKVHGVYTHSYRRKTNTFFTILGMFRQQCQRSRSNYRYKEIEEGTSSNSLTTWAKCKVLNVLVRNTETNFGRQSLSHHYVPVSTRRMRCKSCQRRWKRELFAKDILSLERTKSNTPKYMDSQNSDVSSMPRETESNLQTWNFDPIPSESRNWPDESLQGQAAHTKNWRIFKHDAQPSQTHHVIATEFFKKSTRRYKRYVDFWLLVNDFKIYVMHFRNN